MPSSLLWAWRWLRLGCALLAVYGSCTAAGVSAARPRVIVTTDVNIRAGDPDDRQSLVHLFYYLDELELKGIVADRSESPPARALEACSLAIDAYATDFADPRCRLRERGYPAPDEVRRLVRRGGAEGAQAIVAEAKRDGPRPLYILVWGNMSAVQRALFSAPEIAPKLRVLSIGTFIKSPDTKMTAPEPNWNSRGRKEIFEDPRFRELWWVENDWSHIGMFAGVSEHGGAAHAGPPVDVLHELARFGALGRHLVDVTEGNAWARYFRVGDTPSVLYLIEPGAKLDAPATSTWAGKYVRPFPQERPNYWIDHAGEHPWDFAQPSRTWSQAPAVLKVRTEAVVAVREAIYAAFLAKVRGLYATP
jgi:hypothetical protein